MTSSKRTQTKTPAESAESFEPRRFAAGDKVVVAGAGREWPGKVVARRLADGRESIHPAHDDTAVFVTFEETGVSMPVSIRQLSRSARR
jgi:hypothetical protein